MLERSYADGLLTVTHEGTSHTILDDWRMSLYFDANPEFTPAAGYGWYKV